MAPPTSSLEFEVKRCQYELVTPANPTPRELKMLSAIDSQIDLRCQVPLTLFFRHEPAMAGKDPVDVIRQALAKILVFYYPFAGRLIEGPNETLMVDCTGEGVIFIEADADVMLEQFGKDLYPPFPCSHELLFNVPGSDGIIHSPLLLIQVTRLKCGGFIFAIRFNHTMCDATGIGQFIKGLGEIACGESKPTILPVWKRELLCARDPPKITCLLLEYEQAVLPNNKNNTFILHSRSFFFGPTEIAAIRRLLPQHLAKSTSFEVLTAFVWRCRTLAVKWENPKQKVRFLCVVNARYGHCRFTHPLPDGFYGNALVFPTVITTVEKLCNRPLEYALELVKKAKNKASEEYVHSVADLLTIKKSSSYACTGIESFMITDLTKARIEDVNFGWGKTLYGGIACFLTLTPCVPYTNSKGEKGRMVPICLPKETMESFVMLMHDLLKDQE